jgi:hypothetical protein
MIPFILTSKECQSKNKKASPRREIHSRSRFLFWRYYPEYWIGLTNQALKTPKTPNGRLMDSKTKCRIWGASIIVRGKYVKKKARGDRKILCGRA